MLKIQTEHETVFGGKYVAYNDNEMVGYLVYHKSADAFKIKSIVVMEKGKQIAASLIEYFYKENVQELETRCVYATSAPSTSLPNQPTRQAWTEILIKWGIRVSGEFERYEESDINRNTLVEKYMLNDEEE